MRLRELICGEGFADSQPPFDFTEPRSPSLSKVYTPSIGAVDFYGAGWNCKWLAECIRDPREYR